MKVPPDVQERCHELAGLTPPAKRPRRARTAAPPVPERLFQVAVLEFAELHGWRVYSVPDSRRATAAGWPDLVLAKDGRGVVAAELKRAGKKPRAIQRWWLDRLRESGVPVFVWTNDDWPQIQAVLGNHRGPAGADTAAC
jgi:hypothetical protein